MAPNGCRWRDLPFDCQDKVGGAYVADTLISIAPVCYPCPNPTVDIMWRRIWPVRLLSFCQRIPYPSIGASYSILLAPTTLHSTGDPGCKVSISRTELTLFVRQAEAKATRLLVIIIFILHAALAITLKVEFFSYYVVKPIGGEDPIPIGG